MAMGNIGPGGRWDGDKVMTEVDEGFDVLPVVQVEVLQRPDRKGYALSMILHIATINGTIADRAYINSTVRLEF